jgi:hypothetical protein
MPYALTYCFSFAMLSPHMPLLCTVNAQSPDIPPYPKSKTGGARRLGLRGEGGQRHGWQAGARRGQPGTHRRPVLSADVHVYAGGEAPARRLHAELPTDHLRRRRCARHCRIPCASHDERSCQGPTVLGCSSSGHDAARHVPGVTERSAGSAKIQCRCLGRLSEESYRIWSDQELVEIERCRRRFQ